MSNLGAYGATKNPPWTRNNNSPANLVNQNPNLQQQIMSQGAFGGMNATGMVQLQQQHQQQVLQNAMNMQHQNLSLGLQQLANTSVAVSAGLSQQIASSPLFQQVGAVTYPNPRALNPSAFQTQVVTAATAGVQQSNNSSTKQRVFTGTVTKLHENFGFVDDDVFFQTTACAKGSNPMIGDRVLVEATYNPTMPFKWHATRMQVLPTSTQNSMSRNSNNPKGGGQRSKASMGGRGRERSRTRDDDEENDRKRRREDRLRDRDRDDRKTPIRRRSRSPKSRRRSRIVPRYMVQIPKISLDLKNADVLEIRRRYANLYIPSDFFSSEFRWVDAFAPDKPFSLNKPCSFHVMHKEVDPISENDAVLEPSDADYIFSAKVMLLSVSGLEDMYQRCCALAEDTRRDSDSEDRDYIHPTRLINFLVGVRGKNETMAIGGPWSKSLDGENPEKDPSVLIRTAIRTCKALTGIDLSACTQWYRFVELYYRRAEAVHRGKTVPARVETVVLFLPDVWSCLPTRLEWDALVRGYQKQLENRIVAEGEDTPVATPADLLEKEEETAAEKLEPTHYSELDTKAMSVAALRSELKARNLNAKGLKSQLVARLQKALKAEAEKSEGAKEENVEVENENIKEKKPEGDEKKIDEKERQQLEKRYALPDQPHIIVHPNRVAKSGKFDCTVMSLSLLLDYRPEDTKEHSFEVSLFAELFNEMLMRDFGFNIYKALCELPEKAKDKEKDKDDKKKKDDKGEKGKSKEKEDDKKKEKDEKKKEEKEIEEKDKKSENKEKDRKSEESKDDKKSDKEEKKRDSKKDDKRSDKEDDSEEDDDYDRRSDRDKRRKERLKMFTKDRNLLLSFIYFDQTHCGYIFEKDMEDLLFTLGLKLSRAQVRKLVGKVVSRDSLHYRKLTDKPKEDDFIVIDDSEKDINIQELAIGNRNLLPIFVDKDEVPVKKARIDGDGSGKSLDEGLIVYKGAIVDVSKLMAQLERSEKARIETETCMVDLKTENNRLSEKNSKHNSTIKSLNSELKEYKEKLKNTEDSLSRTTACSKLFQTTLVDIREKIDPVLKSAAHIKEEIKRERDGDRERKHEESKSRWERNPKEKDVKEKEIVVKEEKDKEKEKEVKGKEKEKEKGKEKDKEQGQGDGVEETAKETETKSS